ncbi:Cyclin [Phytophthora megakarya]|uniref:Cyclin n=1 Tax=Phytophthora megakarya TaxID=4795 RepID=A0A225V144_9STRA|nr:Cyclin [Phytophthora megakarya]
MERTKSSGAADAMRKRKRGALQDISNNAKKITQSRASTRRSGVVKNAPKPKLKAPRVSTRFKTTATTVNSALKSSMASTAASKAKKRAPAAKKTEITRAKKRKLEGPENQHQKIQTSMLSFQAAKPKGKKAEEERKPDDEKVEVQAEVVDVEAGMAVKKDIDKKNETETKTKGVRPEETQSVTVAEPTVVPVPRDEFAPRPYTCTFDHKNSCFDEETYLTSVRDIDAPSATISSHHAKLIQELDTYYRKHEVKYLPEADYIGTVQLDINEKMRTILVDWLVEVGEEYELDSQTFHKAVNLVDRCLKKIKINRKQFQLLGCACMMIAAKFEEVYGPNVEEFVYISDQTYTGEEMLDMEVQVLKALEYRVASTTCYGFIHRYMLAGLPM